MKYFLKEIKYFLVGFINFLVLCAPTLNLVLTRCLLRTRNVSRKMLDANCWIGLNEIIEIMANSINYSFTKFLDIYIFKGLFNIDEYKVKFLGEKIY